MADRWWYPPKNVTAPDGEELGYWASRWVEFKRLIVQMTQENDMNRAIFIVGPPLLAILFFGVAFLGWR